MEIAESSQIISELNTPGTKKGCTSHLGLSPNLLKLLQNESYSRKNFAANLVVKCFPREDIRVSNCAGVRGKKKLDPDMMASVRNLVYETYLLEKANRKTGRRLV